jgi:hypothetical protein
MLEKISSEDPYCTILTGDFNAHNQKCYSGERTTDKYGKDMQEIFEKNNLYQTVDQPMYIIGESKTCIDLVCTDQPNLITSNEIHPSLLGVRGEPNSEFYYPRITDNPQFFMRISADNPQPIGGRYPQLSV